MWQHNYTRPVLLHPLWRPGNRFNLQISSPSCYALYDSWLICSLLHLQFSTFNRKHTFYVCIMPNKHSPKVSNVVVHWTMHSTCCPDILIIQNYASIMSSSNNTNSHLHPTWECGISSRLQSQMRRAGDRTTQWKYTSTGGYIVSHVSRLLPSLVHLRAHRQVLTGTPQ